MPSQSNSESADAFHSAAPRPPRRKRHWRIYFIDSYYAYKYSEPVVERDENWTTQLRKGVLELCILNIIGHSRIYGYDIVRQLREVDALVVREGTIYPILS